MKLNSFLYEKETKKVVRPDQDDLVTINQTKMVWLL